MKGVKLLITYLNTDFAHFCYSCNFFVGIYHLTKQYFLINGLTAFLQQNIRIWQLFFGMNFSIGKMAITIEDSWRQYKITELQEQLTGIDI